MTAERLNIKMLWLPQDKRPVDAELDDHCHRQSALLPIRVHCGNISLHDQCVIFCTDHTYDTLAWRRITEKAKFQTPSASTVSVQSCIYGQFFLCVFPPMRGTRVLLFLSHPNNFTCPAPLPHPLPCHLSVRLWGNTEQPTSVCMHTVKVYVICLHIKHASYRVCRGMDIQRMNHEGVTGTRAYLRP